jgi:hypothetical protein
MLVVMLQDTILINKLYNVWRQLQTIKGTERSVYKALCLNIG